MATKNAGQRPSADRPVRRRTKDRSGIRQRGGAYQVRVSGGTDPITGRPVVLTGTAPTESDAIRLRDRFRNDISDNKASRTTATLAYLLHEWLDRHDAAVNTVENYRFLVETFVVPSLGSESLTRLATLGTLPFERLYAELRRCRRRCDGKPFVEHRKGCRLATDPDYRCDRRCKPHSCEPLGASGLRQTHIALNLAFKAAVRWRWIGVNPIALAVKPRAPKPNPDPPSNEDAARLIDTAFAIDDDWGTFVWLTMITGARRGEMVALRWFHVQIRCAECEVGIGWDDEVCENCGRELKDGRKAKIRIMRGRTQRSGRITEADTKDHESRIVSLDPVTMEFLVWQWRRYVDRVRALSRAPRLTPTSSRTSRTTAAHATRTASATNTLAWRNGSAPTRPFTRCATTARPISWRQASTCPPSPTDSATATARQSSNSTPRGARLPTSGRPRC